MNKILKAIKERRSIRKYKSDMLPKEIIDQVIESGLYAASGKGQYINVPSKLYLTDPPSQATEGAVGGLMGAVAVPVMAVLAIPALVVVPFLIPFMKIGNTP